MKVVAFDTETKGLNPFDPEEQAFLASWADEKGQWFADLSDQQAADKFLAELEAADVLVCHNASFDIHQVRETLGWDAMSSGKTIYDTDLLSRVLHPEGQRKGERGGHGLKNLATVFLSADADAAETDMLEKMKSLGLKKSDRASYYDTWRAFPEAMEYYAELDARYTYDLFQIFDAEEPDNGTCTILNLEAAVLPILINAERIGIRLDKDAVVRHHTNYSAKRATIFEELERELGTEALGGPGSEEALIEALQSQGIELTELTPSGQLATNKFALQPFAAEFPIVGKLEEYRQVCRFLDTYLGPMQGKDVIHTNFRQIGAWTGRMSSARPNMQNIPNRAGKEVREVFIPRDGCAFVVSDYDSIEAKLLAYYLGDEVYRELVDKRDPHAWMASNIWPGGVEAFAKGGPNDDKRTLAKNILFAITYGAGKKRVRNMLVEAGFDIEPAFIKKEDRYETREEALDRWAKTLISTIKGNLPNFYRLNKRIRAKIEAVGFVTTIMGRRSPVKKDKSYVGLNALIQGSAADIMKQGVINVDKAFRDAKLDANILLLVHDEILTECRIEDAPLVQKLQDAAMLAAWDLNPPLAVTSGITTKSYADGK